MTILPVLRARGFDVLPLVGPGTTIVRWLRERGIRDFELSPDLPGNWGRARGLERAGRLARYRRCRDAVAATVARLVRERGIDLVCAAMPFSWAAATPVARALGVPIVWRAGGPVWLGGRLLGSLVLGPWATLHPPDLLICSSEMVRRSFAGLVRAPRVAVLNGVDLERFHPGAVQAGGVRPREAGLVVGYAGRLVARKGIETLLDVAGRMARTRPEMRFLLAGDGERRAAYERLARATGAAENTRFLGYQGDVRRFYAACDVVVLPSESEGASMVVLEAMAMGRALLLSDIPSLRELACPDEHAVFAPVGDAAALARALERLAADPDRRAALGGAAAARARERFDARTAAEHTAALFADVLGAAWGQPGDEPSQAPERARAASGTRAERADEPGRRAPPTPPGAASRERFR